MGNVETKTETIREPQAAPNIEVRQGHTSLKSLIKHEKTEDEVNQEALTFLEIQNPFIYTFKSNSLCNEQSTSGTGDCSLKAQEHTEPVNQTNSVQAGEIIKPSVSEFVIHEPQIESNIVKLSYLKNEISKIECLSDENPQDRLGPLNLELKTAFLPQVPLELLSNKYSESNFVERNFKNEDTDFLESFDNSKPNKTVTELKDADTQTFHSSQNKYVQVISSNHTDSDMRNNQCIQWSTSYVVDYLSEVYKALESEKDPSVVTTLRSKTNFLIQKIKEVDNINTDGHLEARDNLEVSEEAILSRLLKSHSFLSVETPTVFSCTLCKSFIDRISSIDAEKKIKSHMESDTHKMFLLPNKSYKNNEEKCDSSFIDNYLPQKYQDQKSYFKVVGEALECILCKENILLDVNSIVDHVEKESHWSLCCMKQVENKLSENYSNAMEYIKTNSASVKRSKVPLFYICCFCDFVTHIWDIWRNHAIAELSYDDKNSAVTASCGSCKVILLGDNSVWNEHCLISTHTNLCSESPENHVKAIFPTINPNINDGGKPTYNEINISVEEKHSVQENFLSKIVKQFKNLKNGPTIGFYCSYCNIYLIYRSDAVEHPRAHVKIENSKLVNCRKYICVCCNIDLYSDINCPSEHVALPSHKVMAQLTGHDPGDLHVVCQSSTVASRFPLYKVRNINEISEVKVECDGPDIYDFVIEGSKLKSKESSKGKKHNMIHKLFLKQVLQRFCETPNDTSESVDKCSYVTGFFCSFCNVFGFYSPEMTKHEHALPLDYNDSAVLAIKKFYCTSCNVDLFGNVATVNKHNELSGHNIMAKGKSFAQTLNYEIYDPQIISKQNAKYLTSILKDIPYIRNNYNIVMSIISMRVIPIKTPVRSEFVASDKLHVCVPCDFVTDINNVFIQHSNERDHLTMKKYYCDFCQLELIGSNEIGHQHNALAQHLYVKEVATKSLRDESVSTEHLTQHIEFIETVGQLANVKIDPVGFYCKLCDCFGFYNDIQDTQHTESKQHIMKLNNGDFCVKYYCPVCKIDLLGQADVLQDHNNLLVHKNIMKSKNYNSDNRRCVLDLDSALSTANINQKLANNEIYESASLINIDNTVNLSNTNGPLTVISNLNLNNTTVPMLVPTEHSTIVSQAQKKQSAASSIINLKSNMIKNEENQRTINNVNIDINHQNLMSFVINAYLKSPQLPSIIAYLCEECAISTENIEEWENHLSIHRKCLTKCEYSFCDYFCNKCRASFICTKEYFQGHLLSFSHNGIDKIINDKRKFEKKASTQSNNENKPVLNLQDTTMKRDNTNINMDEMIKDELCIATIPVVGDCKEDNDVSTREESDNEDNYEGNIEHDSASTSETYDSGSEDDNSYINEEEKNQLQETTGNELCSLDSEVENDATLVSKEPLKKAKRKSVEIIRISVGIKIEGLPSSTKPGALYKLFFRLGYHVNYVRVNYKGKADCALITFLGATDVENILGRKKPLLLEGKELKLTEVFREKKNKIPTYHTAAKLDKLFYSPDVLMGVVDKLILNYCSTSEEEVKRTNHLLNDIKDTLEEVDVYPFGSRIYGISSRNSDLDVFVDIDGRTYFDSSMNEYPRKEHNIIKCIGQEFRRSKIFYKVITIKARVPIVRLVHKPSGLACDISCKNGLSVENTKLTKCYLESDPRVAWLVTAVKFWAEINLIKGSSRFTSYALTWMVLFYLMQCSPPVICSVIDLRKLPNANKPNIIGWNCNFCSDVKLYPKSQNKQLVVELLHDFFVFFSSFDCQNYVLCPISGTAIPSKDFKNLKLPNCFKTYTEKLKKNSDVQINLDSSLCLQDPFDLGHNLTSRVKKHLFEHFRNLCIRSAKLCEDW